MSVEEAFYVDIDKPFGSGPAFLHRLERRMT